MNKSALIVAMIVAGLVAACGHKDDTQVVQQPTPQYAAPAPVPAAPQVVQAAPAPVIINQPAPAQDSHLNDMLLGGIIGHMIGSSSAPSAAVAAVPQRQTTVVNKTIINKTYVQEAPKPAPAPVAASAPKPAMPAPVVSKPASVYSSARPMSFGGGSSFARVGGRR